MTGHTQMLGRKCFGAPIVPHLDGSEGRQGAPRGGTADRRGHEGDKGEDGDPAHRAKSTARLLHGAGKFLPQIQGHRGPCWGNALNLLARRCWANGRTAAATRLQNAALVARVALVSVLPCFGLVFRYLDHPRLANLGFLSIESHVQIAHMHEGQGPPCFRGGTTTTLNDLKTSRSA